MMNKISYRGFMLTAGILVAAGILFSQVLFHQSGLIVKKTTAATEQTDGDHEKAVQVAPTLVNPSASVQLDTSVGATVEQVLEAEDHVPLRPTVVEICVPYLKTLLRTLIAPNAP